MNASSDTLEAKLADLGVRLEQLTGEVRRQGRAAVAAQAAAEACLDEVRQMGLAQTESDARFPESESESTAADTAWVVALLPVFDALDRSVAQAESAAAAFARRGWLKVVPGVRQAESALLSLARGLDLMRAQRDEILARLGVEVDREAPAPFDPRRHRAVEVRVDPSGADNRVVEVVRAGYRTETSCIRETEVVIASKPTSVT